MKLINHIVLLALATLTGGSICAQPYSDTDPVTGDAIYYKIVSANPDYSGKCIEDNYRNQSTSDYDYLVNNLETDNYYQEWQLIPDDSNEGFYYIRNRRTRRFINTKGTWLGAYFSISNGANKIVSSPYQLVSLENGQTAFKYADDLGDCYLHAADSAQAPTKMSTTNLSNSTWAWVITNPDGSPTDVSSLVNGNSSIKVYSQKHQIVVVGTEDYEIHDLLGRSIPKQGSKLPGSYIVSAKGKNYKVLVQ